MATQQSLPRKAAQAAASTAAVASHRALSSAQEGIYAALGRPQPGREGRWAERVANALHELRVALLSHEDQIQGPGGLYEEIRLDAPWLVPRMSQLVSQMARIQAEAADLSTEVERVRNGDHTALPAIRGDAERLLHMLRDLTAKEAEVMYERFNEPAAQD